MSTKLSNADLYQGYVDPKLSKKKVAKLSLDGATRMVARRRQKKVSGMMRNVDMSDAEIARSILDYAQEVPVTRSPDMPDDERLLIAIFDKQRELLIEQQRQTSYLKSINTVMQIWGALLILGVMVSCLWVLFGRALF